MGLDPLIPTVSGWPAGLVMAAAGLLVCLRGEALVRTALALAGFLLVGSGAATVAAMLTQSVLWSVGVFLVCGALGAALAGALVPLGMFMLGAALGYTLCAMFTDMLLGLWGAALVTGVLFVVLEKRVLALGTAGFGSALLWQGTLKVLLAVPACGTFLEPHLESPLASVVMFVLWAALALHGYSGQVRRRREGRKRDGDED